MKMSIAIAVNLSLYRWMRILDSTLFPFCSYLVKYSYKNAEQDDLWQELTETSVKHNALTRNVTVKEVMDTWTTQTGYPLLTVERDYSANTLTITQVCSPSQVTRDVVLNVCCNLFLRQKMSVINVIYLTI